MGLRCRELYLNRRLRSAELILWDNPHTKKIRQVPPEQEKAGRCLCRIVPLTLFALSRLLAYHKTTRSYWPFVCFLVSVRLRRGFLFSLAQLSCSLGHLPHRLRFTGPMPPKVAAIRYNLHLPYRCQFARKCLANSNVEEGSHGQ
jgi:hypothetical protein